SRKPIYALARSRDLWKKRIAILATFRFIRQHDIADALAIAGILIKDDHDLIQKAVGWMLREVGKRCSQATAEKFLKKHTPRMPRTMLRYALEHFPPQKRAHYMNIKQS
ncbi:MAG: DNA alkylation repair protein, partial [Sedimentisphaerales bacterium]|nr:DNA alkylation repair protein [Sedimentisphaerales bacterium]